MAKQLYHDRHAWHTMSKSSNEMNLKPRYVEIRLSNVFISDAVSKMTGIPIFPKKEGERNSQNEPKHINPNESAKRIYPNESTQTNQPKQSIPNE